MVSELDLANNPGMGDAGVAAILTALPARFQALNMSHIRFGDGGAAALVGALRRAPELRELLLTQTGIGRLGDDRVRALAEALPPTLTKLRLSGDGIGREGTHALAEAFKRLPMLSELYYSYLEEESIPILVPALIHLRNITVLDFTFSRLGDEGASALAAVLPRLTALSRLKLNANRIGNAGTAALAAVLPHLTALSVLDLSSNDIGAEGAVALAAVLPRLTALSFLDVRENAIRDWDVIRRAAPPGCVVQI
jgi:Ran GTPase-activating protein (RanGAP) involved in mRNA processing and transport